MTARQRPLKIGLQLPEAEREVPWREMLAMARLAEDAGFDSIWLGDHLLYRYEDGSARGPWEAWSLLAALAAATERVELGPLVACTSFHSPPMLAKKAATVDEISGGRLILGLGAGWHEPEYRAFGFPFDHRVDRFAEAFTIIRTLLRDGEIDFQGRYYTARECELIPRPTRPGGPPLMVGSKGPRMLQITAPHIDAWNVWHAYYGNDPAGLPPLVQRLEEACAETGRDPSTITKTAAVLVQLNGTGRPTVDEDDAHGRPLTGTPEEIARALLAYVPAGIAHLQLVLDPITCESIEEMGRVLELIDARAEAVAD